MTPSDPADPTDLSRPRRLHPLSPVLDLFPLARQALIPLLVLAVNLRILGLVLFVVATAATVAFRALAWSRFSYSVVNGTLRVEHGVFQRHVREVPVTRIQQVDLRRQLRHRVAGLVAVRVDTAGGGQGAEVVLDCLAEPAAVALRSELLDPRHRVEPASAPAGDPWPGQPTTAWPSPAQSPGTGAGQQLIHLSTRDLVVAGVTGSGLLAGLSVVGLVFLFVGELPEAATAEVGGRVTALFGTVILVTVAVVLALPFFLASAALASVMRDHDFTLMRYGNDLHIRRGLLDQREATVALHRIQAVWLLDNPLRRRLGLVAVQLQSAGGSRDQAGDAATTTIPLVRRRDLADLLSVVLPASTTQSPGDPAGQLVADSDLADGLVVQLLAAPTVARRRSLVRFVVPAVLVAPLVGLVTGSLFTGVVNLAVMGGAAAALGLARYRALGHATSAGMVVARSGAVIRRTALVPIARTQSQTLVSSPFQRRLGLASLAVHVAGRGRAVWLIDLEVDRCREVGAHALGSAEARRDEAAVRRRTAGMLASPAPWGHPAIHRGPAPG